MEDRNTFNRLACQQPGSTVAFESCRYIKLEKHKLDHIGERKIRISLDKLLYSFLEVKLQRLLRKRYEDKNDISSILSNSSNLCLRRCQIKSKSNTQITAEIM